MGKSFLFAPILMVLNWSTVLSAATIEDEAHRLDRLETKMLNETAAHKIMAAKAGLEAVRTPPVQPLTPAEKALEARERQALSDWKRQSEMCPERPKAACKPD